MKLWYRVVSSHSAEACFRPAFTTFLYEGGQGSVVSKIVRREVLKRVRFAQLYKFPAVRSDRRVNELAGVDLPD